MLVTKPKPNTELVESSGANVSADPKLNSSYLIQIVPWVQGLCVLNMVVLVFHFFAVGFFHPETPRYLFAVKDKKAECANALQWLRGRMADIGQEYTDLADSILIHGPANPIDASGLDLMKDRYVG